MANFNYINEEKIEELKKQKIKLQKEITFGTLLTIVTGAIATINAPEFFLAGISAVSAITTGFAVSQFSDVKKQIKNK